jgi:hypothetical protein
MIEPEYFEKIQNNEVIAMYSKLSQQLTQSIIKQLQEQGDISSYTKSQIRTLQKIGGNKILLETLNKTNKLSNKRKAELKKLFENIGSESLKGYKTQYERVGEEYKITAEQYTLISSALRRTNNEFKNLTKTIAYSSSKTYVKALDELYTKVASRSIQL